ncbi:MAG TPA: molybdopterin cofactor-binding domain-containing protein [Ardenticatenaceae bacterium]|nr:molybdopterin cofactor-binding domain-containing protein [Ardenticatenaceae bacterium]
MAEKAFGKSMKRREDPAFITGTGNYMDDVKLPGMAHAAILRSPHGHARINSINVERAVAHPGVVAVYTGRDLEDGVNPLPCAWQAGGVENNVPPHRVLATDKVRYVGDGVAVVIAEDRYTAEDARDLIEVDYEVLPAVVDAERATQEGAPQLHDEAPNNVCLYWTCGNEESTNQAFAEAEVVVTQRLVNQRLIANPMETRGAICQYQPALEEYTFWLSSQAPHVHRLLLGAFVLGVPEHKIRVIAPDLGGGFGSKIFLYPDMGIVAFAARKLRRPVKWIEDRSENYVATAQGRDHITEAAIAARRDGTITGLRVKTHANLGAYLSTIAPGIPTTLYGRMLSGVYRIPNIFCEVYGVFTNTAMVDAYRGAGRPEATYVVERMVDRLAQELRMDPTEIRRKNFIPTDAFPYDPAGILAGLKYDSGDYEPALNKALDVVDYAALRREQEEARRQGRYLGIGFSTYVEICGVAPSAWIGLPGQGWGAGLWESANVRVHLTGKVVVTTGSLPHGQGHPTAFAQIVADELGVPMEDVDVQYGDTLNSPFGYGSYGSRSMAVGGAAIHHALQKVKDKAKRLAAHMLEASEDDIMFEDGRFFVRGVPGTQKTIQEVALAAHVAYSLPPGMEPYLDETAYFDPPNCTFPFGTHICVVEVDPETGKVELRRYVAVDDVGNQINPLLVDGQIHGGIAQGVGQALWEGAVYDEDGQLLTGTMNDYAVPKASFFPPFETAHTVTPTPVNPLGVKGAGETGTIASAPAVVNAVVDALAPFGVKHLDMPLTPEKVWRAMQNGSHGNGSGG